MVITAIQSPTGKISSELGLSLKTRSQISPEPCSNSPDMLHKAITDYLRNGDLRWNAKNPLLWETDDERQLKGARDEGGETREGGRKERKDRARDLQRMKVMEKE